jgi:hypothetical protein
MTPGGKFAFFSLMGLGFVGMSMSLQGFLSALPLEGERHASRAVVWAATHSVEIREGRDTRDFASHLLHAHPEKRGMLIFSLAKRDFSRTEEEIRELTLERLITRVGTPEQAWNSTWLPSIQELENIWISYSRPRSRQSRWNPPEGFPFLPSGMTREDFIRYPTVQAWWRDRIGLTDRRVLLHPNMNRTEWVRRVHGPIQDIALSRASEDLMASAENYERNGHLRHAALSAAQTIYGIPIALIISCMLICAMSWKITIHVLNSLGFNTRFSFLMPVLLFSISVAINHDSLEDFQVFERFSINFSSLIYPYGESIRSLSKLSLL